MVTRRAQWKLVLEGSTIVGLFILDRAAKWFAVQKASSAEPGEKVETLLEWVRGHMVLRYNADIAFNIQLPEIIIMPAVLLLCFYLVSCLVRAISAKNSKLAVIILMPLIGAASNLMDRLQYGAVIDYISFGGGFGFFNIADILIIGGIALWVPTVADGHRLK